MTVDNASDPAILSVNGADSGPETTTLTMSWYAIPDAYSSHAQIEKTFTWVMYTALQGVTWSGLDASSYEFYIGVSGQEIAFPSWTLNPSTLSTVVLESLFYLNVNSVDIYSSGNLINSSDFLTVDQATARAIKVETDDVSKKDTTHDIALGWTFDDGFGFS